MHNPSTSCSRKKVKSLGVISYVGTLHPKTRKQEKNFNNIGVQSKYATGVQCTRPKMKMSEFIKEE